MIVCIWNDTRKNIHKKNVYMQTYKRKLLGQSKTNRRIRQQEWQVEQIPSIPVVHRLNRASFGTMKSQHYHYDLENECATLR